MSKKLLFIVAGIAVALAAGAVLASGADAGGTEPEPPGGGGTSIPSGPPNPFADFTTIPMYDEGVAPETIAESNRLRSEVRGRGAVPPRPGARPLPSLEERLEWSRGATEREQERFRARRSAGFPAEHHPVDPPDGAACERLCALFGRCAGGIDAADRRSCRDACGRAEYGGRRRVNRIVELDSCDHL